VQAAVPLTGEITVLTFRPDLAFNLRDNAPSMLFHRALGNAPSLLRLDKNGRISGVAPGWEIDHRHHGQQIAMNESSLARLEIDSAVELSRPDDLTREVYGVMGVPVDVSNMETVLRRVDAAAERAEPFHISTINLNWLIISQFDEAFREFLSVSDLSTADSITVVWLARLLGAPIKERITGADIFEQLKSMRDSTNPLKVFLLGGPEGVAAKAHRNLNAESDGIECTGSLSPGFGTVDELSTNSIIEAINSSNADFLVTSMGAKKGQAWLRKNINRIQIPIRAHLGATMNFQAGTVRRAPVWVQKWGFEWLWRIKEEPHLWRRYWHDGTVLLRLMVTRIVPFIILSKWLQLRCESKDKDLRIERDEDQKSVILSIKGIASGRNVGEAIRYFQDAALTAKDVAINFAGTRLIDARFIGLLLMLDKQLKGQQLRLTFTGISPQIERLFYLSGFEFLLGA
jgi:N-acetylglucosaminyldiphosphoundecaprenol N-acetyl-beta-D-mannosaminyltransferase